MIANCRDFSRRRETRRTFRDDEQAHRNYIVVAECQDGT